MVKDNLLIIHAMHDVFRRLKLNETQIGQCFRLLHENSKSNSGLATPNKRHMFSNFEESSSEKFNQQKQTNERRPFTWREYLMLTTSIIFEDIETLLDKVSFQFNQKVISSLRRKFLPDPTQLAPDGLPRRTLVLDLDETLVYSQWKASEGWKTLVRPGVETFLEQMSHLYEIVLFTSSLPEHVDPIVRQIDSGGIKDLSRLNRDLKRTIIVDNEPQCFKYQPLNGIAVPSWKGNEDDRCLFELTSLLEYIVRQDVPDVRDVIEKYWRGELALSSTEFVR
ncbi:Mitochondrial import inner membrane translocase subunit TIM50 [Galdieria sulphuraria]|nr:Mitochondrial import inner membrane translocase subunit TIM50 [Galdieria sulphuraria]